MTSQEFQINHGPKLKEFIQSPLGQATINTVHAMKPNYEASPHEHIFLENRGLVRGYEMAIRNLAFLTFVPVINPDAEQNYGVKDPDEKQIPVPVFSTTQEVKIQPK